jgi:uncharacterized protein
MLFVNAKAGPSPTHRMGLIAQVFIPEGTKIWGFMPGFDLVIPESELAQLSPTAQDQVVYWAYFDLKTREFVLSGDDDRFTNHSDDPNTSVIDDGCTIANRDIYSGEEITTNYAELVIVNFPEGNTYGVQWAKPV